jgi:cytidine deaminase
VNRVNKIIKIARALKPLQQHFRSFHLAAIYKKNQLISIGTNTQKTHPKTIEYGYPFPAESVHAECLAVIRGRLEDYSGYDLIVVRINNRNELALSKPCKYCQHLLNKMNFNSIIYSGENGALIKESKLEIKGWRKEFGQFYEICN